MALTVTLTSGTSWVNGMSATSTNLNNAVNLATMAMTVTQGALVGAPASGTTVGEVTINNIGATLHGTTNGLTIGDSGANSCIAIGQSSTANALIKWSYNGTEANALLLVDGNSGSGNALVTKFNAIFSISNSGTKCFQTDVNGNVVSGTGSTATNMTSGFFYVPTISGTPTGAPTSYTNTSPIVVDNSGSKLWVRISGSWKSCALT